MRDLRWILPFNPAKRNYEDVGYLPYVLEHDRGFAGDKIYRIVRRLPGGEFQCVMAEELTAKRYNRRAIIAEMKIRHQGEVAKVAEPVERDFKVEDNGTIVLVIPQSDAAKQWVEANVHSEPWQWYGPALAVEPRMVEEIMEGALNDGLSVEVDL